MSHESIRTIHEEHATLSALLRSLDWMVRQGPKENIAAFFEVLRAMLFYIDEFPERQHHPKETELLFPPVAARDAQAAAAIAQLDQDHARGESEVRELQHLLLAWELLGEPRRAAFEQALARYLVFYGAHMHLEESVVIPAALRVLTDADWARLDAAFATNRDPLSGKYPRDPVYDRLFSQILSKAPAPIGLG
ncbi:MAG: hemerythrin domain-containing protein [Burkholderiaceae bacterium]|nr:hemerythrin domain-containing protein [Burkholderiaceae bacterium]MDP3423642.1 hemerythrin domain-containing protein [Burkholderiaceae bacterium]MDZ4161746.1 hemerythrin domain-containing protein [Burkholderiales bacterium]